MLGAGCWALGALTFPLRAAPVTASLPNGLRVVSSDEPGTSRVAVMLMVRAGDADDPPLAPGAARVLGRVLMEPPNHRAPGRFATMVVEGSLRVDTEADVTTFTAVTTPDQAAAAIRLLAAYTEAPVWNNTTLIRDVKREGAGERDSIPSEWERDFSAWRSRAGLSVPPPPLPETVPRETLKALFESRYAANAMVLAVVGDLRGLDVASLAERSFGALPRRPDVVGRRRRVNISSERTPSGDYAFAGYPAPAVTHSLAPAVEVISAAMGLGKTSALFRVLREREGTGYESGVVFPRSLSPTGIALFSRAPGHTAAVRDELVSIWGSAALDKRTEWETARARAVQAYASTHQTARDRAYWLAFWELAGKGAAWDAGYSEAMRTVTTESIQAAAKTYLSGTPTVIP